MESEKKPLLGKHVQTKRGQKYKSGVFYVVRAEIVARQQPARQWTGWVAITWEPQQTRTQK
jgi:hypothetical protein